MSHSLCLTVILKNEIKNLPDFCASIKDCFDEVIFTDTGSIDGSIEWLECDAEKALGIKPVILHFDWVNDFAKARNHALPHIISDYWMWLDLDDRLHNKEVFKKWRDYVMPLAPAWYAKYDYVFNEEGKVTCSFIRERVMRRDLGLRFIDQVHEGVMLDGIDSRTATSWWVDHVRTDAELEGDKGRNLKILEEKMPELSTRLKFYYGKELFDAGKIEESVAALIEAIKPDGLSQTDRILGVQYLCWGLFKLKRYDEVIRYALIGIINCPTRAELFCSIADCYAIRGMAIESMPWYQAAIDCPNASGHGFASVFSANECYGEYPKIQLAKIHYLNGNYKKVMELIDGVQHVDAAGLLLETTKALQSCEQKYDQIEVDDIVITTPMRNCYLWDGDLYREKGMGGSETAAIEMAEWLSEKTNRKVIVFNDRETSLLSKGVVYRPMKASFGYFQKYRPKLSIHWRHVVRLSDGPSILWCHDLITPGAENYSYDKMMCLSNFHKNYVMGVQGIDENKIMITRNGVDPSRFPKGIPVKRHAKVIWPNSPDRGLEHAIRVMDLVQARIPEATLDIFYGFDNLAKYGLAEQANALEAMIKSRPWIKNHGNVEQRVLAEEFSESQVWLYTANFIETFCITAIESLLAKCWPIVRKVGALGDTLSDASQHGMCDLLDLDLNEETYPIWAQYVISAIEEEKWTRMGVDPAKYSWESVADDWIKEFDL